MPTVTAIMPFSYRSDLSVLEYSIAYTISILDMAEACASWCYSDIQTRECRE